MIFNKRTFKRRDSLDVTDIIGESIRNRSTANLKELVDNYKYRRKLEVFAKRAGIVLAILVILPSLYFLFSVTPESSTAPQQGKPVNKFFRPVFVRMNTLNSWGFGDYNKFAQVSDTLYQVAIPLSAGRHTFKLAPGNWGQHLTFGVSKAGVVLPVNKTIGVTNAPNNHNLTVEAPINGTYIFSFELKSPTEFFLSFELIT